MGLTIKQEQALQIILDKYRNRERYVVIGGYAGSGKAQPLDTKIPTPEGVRLLGDLKVGDFVFDRQGKPTKVLGVFPQGKKRVYRISFKDGRSSLCAGDHLWTFYNSKNKRFTKTTLEILNLGLTNSSGFKYRIPTNGAVDYDQKQFDVDPYIMGVFLGDGCCLESYLTLSSEDEEIPTYIGEIIKAKPVKNSDKNYNWTFEWERAEDYKEVSYVAGNGGRRKVIRKKPKTEDYFSKYSKEVIQYSGEKSIPSEYKFGSVEQRLRLIQGLFDTDGSISVSGNRFNIRFSTTSKKLVRDVQEILWSLGYESTISVDKRQDKYSTKICFGLNVNIDNNEKNKLFRLRRKFDIANKAAGSSKHRDYSKIAITNIEELDYETEMVCIYVDNDEHLYLTEDYVVTHNTTLVKHAIAALAEREDVDPETDVCYAAYTGKACQILNAKGNKNAKTLHRLLLKSVALPDGTFFSKPKESIPYSIVVVDECSMLPQEFLNILLSFEDVFTIFLGDPFQLPPLAKNGGANTLLDNPDIFLDEIMRQALDSEIIRLSMTIREQRPILFSKGKEVIVLPRADLSTGMMTWADQILVGTNKTRTAFNQKMRQIYGFSGDIPQEGEKIICVENYWDTFDSAEENNLVNGMIGTVENVSESFIRYRYVGKKKEMDVPTIIGDFKTEDGLQFPILEMDKKMLTAEEACLTPQEKYLISKKPPRFRRPLPKDFLYGYAITVHKAQGSEWNKVLVVEERFPFEKKEHARWLYTAVTRSASKLVLAR